MWLSTLFNRQHFNHAHCQLLLLLVLLMPVHAASKTLYLP
jgi:hypothetical protein